MLILLKFYDQSYQQWKFNILLLSLIMPKQHKKISNLNSSKIKVKRLVHCPSKFRLLKQSVHICSRPIVPTISQENIQYLLNRPVKIINHQKPAFSIPEQLEVLMHQNSTITYEGQKPLVFIEKQEFTKYQGDIKLSVVQMPIDQFQVPKIVQKKFTKIRSVNLWIYKGYRQTQWHFDGSDNFLYVIRGKKIIQLLPSNSLKANDAFSLSNNRLKLNVSPNAIKKARRITVKAGQCLFIPRGWWHHVISKGKVIIALNFWGNSYGQLKQVDYIPMLRHLVFQLTENKCQKKVPQWDQLQQNIKRDYRLAYFKTIVQQNLL